MSGILINQKNILFTNEAANGDIVDEFIDNKYIESIILKIGGEYGENK